MGFLEYILNTPSHHRVHHGSNPKYIDKNHAGTLIIWDRLFGTFQKEEEEVYYGTTKPLSSWNPLWANVHYWDDLIRTARKAKGIRDKINVFLKPPGWFPEYLGGIQYPSDIDKYNYSKYNPIYNSSVTGYILIQFITALSGGSAILFLYAKMDWLHLISASAFVILTLLSCGALFEQKKWQIKFEYLRLIIGILLVLFFGFATMYKIVFLILLFISLIWFYRLQKMKTNAAKN
jgi:hypothetical protein